MSESMRAVLSHDGAELSGKGLVYSEPMTKFSYTKVFSPVKPLLEELMCPKHLNHPEERKCVGVILAILPKRVLGHTYYFSRREVRPSSRSRENDLTSRFSELFHILWTASAHQVLITAHL